MKRYCVAAAVLVFVMVFGAKTGITAQEQVLMTVNLSKDVSPLGETYGVSFGFSGDVMKKVTQAYAKAPKGARLWVTNTVNLNDIVLSGVNLSLDEFNRWFPSGTYRLSVKPLSYGSLEISMPHNFPQTPAILYPLQGSADVPTNPVITWTPVTGLNGLELQLRDDADFVLNIGLPINATSYGVPANLLVANTRYELAIRAKMTGSGGNGLATTSRISFTTKAQ